MQVLKNLGKDSLEALGGVGPISLQKVEAELRGRPLLTLRADSVESGTRKRLR